MADDFGSDADFDFDDDAFADGNDMSAFAASTAGATGGAGGFYNEDPMQFASAHGMHAFPHGSDNGADNEFGLGDDGEPNPKRQRYDTGDLGAITATPHVISDAPPQIENVQAYFPNVAPDAFPVVVNVLAQASIPEGPDLRKLSCATRNVEFMPKSRNASATMRLQDPNAVVTLRSSGSMSIIGAASISEARQAAELAARIIRKALNMSFQALRFRVRSISARFNVCSPIRIHDLATFRIGPDNQRAHPGVSEVHCSYEPERFNGCVVKLVGTAQDNRWISTCLVFVTGKITMMGARSADELRFSFDALVPILAQYIGGTVGGAAAAPVVATPTLTARAGMAATTTTTTPAAPAAVAVSDIDFGDASFGDDAEAFADDFGEIDMDDAMMME